MKINSQKAFTMVELIFVIIIVGILSAIAVPKFSETTKIAYESRAESVVNALRSAIATERQKRILKGDASTAITGAEAAALLSYGLADGWAVSGNTFTYTVPGGTEKCAFDVYGGKLVKKICDSATGLDDL